MVWISKTLWATGKLVIMDKCFFVLEGHVLMFENCVYGSALIKKIQYRPKGVPEEKMIWHMQQKEVGDVESPTNRYMVRDTTQFISRILSTLCL